MDTCWVCTSFILTRAWGRRGGRALAGRLHPVIEEAEGNINCKPRRVVWTTSIRLYGSGQDAGRPRAPEAQKNTAEG